MKIRAHLLIRSVFLNNTLLKFTVYVHTKILRDIHIRLSKQCCNYAQYVDTLLYKKGVEMQTGKTLSVQVYIVIIINNGKIHVVIVERDFQLLLMYLKLEFNSLSCKMSEILEDTQD